MQPVRLGKTGNELAGALFLPEGEERTSAVIVCHGAGEFKENYFELCQLLQKRGVAALALDLYGHGESAGKRHHVDMRQWVASIRDAIDFLSALPTINPNRIGAFGLSSGGTAVLEASLVDPRLKALITLDPTVRNSLPLATSLFLKSLSLVGTLGERLLNKELRVPIARFSVGPKLASDPEINRRLLEDKRATEAFYAFPLPGAREAFFVDTLKRVPSISAPTLVLWGEDDALDPPTTGHELYRALECEKSLQIIPGNGHVGHLDRNRARVFDLTADWALQHLTNGCVAPEKPRVRPKGMATTIEGEAAKRLTREERWKLLSPFLLQHGREALAYATLQEGMEYFITDVGYVAYTTVRHPVLSPRPRRITLSDPVCSRDALPGLIRQFLADNPRATFGVISEHCAEVLRGIGFKANCIGYEPELAIQSYNTRGNWKELDMIKRARNEAQREGIVIREEEGSRLNAAELSAVSAKWISSKKINDREIWLYARRPIFGHEEGVRKFVAYDRDGVAVGFVFYDPMYRDGKVFGYSANISRCDERRYGRLNTAVHMEAMDKFKIEGAEVLNLLLAPFVKLDTGKYNDDPAAKRFFDWTARFGNSIYNFEGLSFHKSKYRGVEKSLYCASNSGFMMNDLYLAFTSADISRSYFATLGQLAQGMFSALRNGGPK